MGRWVCTMMEGSKGIRIRKGIMREINSGIIKIIRNLNRTSLAHFNESALAPTSLLNRWIHSFIELKVFGNQKHHYFDWFKKLINVNRLNIDSLVGSIIGDGDDWWLMNAFGSRYLFTLPALSLYKESHVFKKIAYQNCTLSKCRSDCRCIILIWGLLDSVVLILYDWFLDLIHNPNYRAYI